MDSITARLIDSTLGEWFRVVTREGKLNADAPKASFWKCPYHNGRTGLEVVRRLGEMVGKAHRKATFGWRIHTPSATVKS